MIQTLHSLRFVFIMLIVASHIIGGRFDFGGECGVSFFFMLSGFVLSVGYGSRVEERQFGTRPFVLRQLLKFYPLHLAVLVVMVLLDSRLGQYYDWQHLLPGVFLLQSWIPREEYFFAINAPSWFLCDILFFYVVFAAAYRWLNRVELLRLLPLAAIVIGFYMVLALNIPDHFVNGILYALPLTRLLDFCMGILLCRMYRSEAGRRSAVWLFGGNRLMLTLFELLLLGVMVASFFVYEHLSPQLRCAALFWLVLPQFLLSFAMLDRHGGWLTQLLRTPAMLWLGSISLEIYLMHMLVFRVVSGALASVGIQGVVVQAATGLAVVIPVAYLTKRFFVDKIYVSLVKFVA